MFEVAQATLKKNGGCSETLQASPERDNLLKRVIRCAYCGMPMWCRPTTMDSGIIENTRGHEVMLSAKAREALFPAVWLMTR